MLSRPDSSPFVSTFFFLLLFFYRIFQFEDNTLRIDITQIWIINRGQDWATFQSRERVKSEGKKKIKPKEDRKKRSSSQQKVQWTTCRCPQANGPVGPWLARYPACTSYTPQMHAHTHPTTHLPACRPPTPTPPTLTLWKYLLHFPLISPFSLVLTRGGPLYSPLHARSQRCDRSLGPCAGSPLFSCLPALPACLPDGSALLIYSSNLCCLSQFRTTKHLDPLICITHLLFSFSLTLFFLSFHTFYLSPCSMLHNFTLWRVKKKDKWKWGQCRNGNTTFFLSP